MNLSRKIVAFDIKSKRQSLIANRRPPRKPLGADLGERILLMVRLSGCWSKKGP